MITNQGFLTALYHAWVVKTTVHRLGDVSAVPLAYKGFMFVCICGDHQSSKTLNETLEGNRK